jgi:hypothetical protein
MRRREMQTGQGRIFLLRSVWDRSSVLRILNNAAGDTAERASMLNKPNDNAIIRAMQAFS